MTGCHGDFAMAHLIGLSGTALLTHTIQKLGNFRSPKSPLSGTLDRVEAGTGEKFAQIGVPVD
jgi:hypothetical protein